MKSAQLEEGYGKPLPEIILILNPKEALIFATAVRLYAADNKRNKLAKKLDIELASAAIFF